MYFYPGSEELICLSCLLPCCMTGFIFPVITDYTRYQGVLRQLYSDCVLAQLYLKAQFQAGHRLGGRPLVLVTVGLLVVVVMVSNC